MNKIMYIGPFKEHLYNHVKLKKAIGCKYDIDASHLKLFDTFTIERYPKASTLTKEIVLDWCKKRSYETQATQLGRASILRQFGKYLASLGIEAYIIPKGYYPKEKQYVPYIYTVDELQRFFAETDKCNYCSECPYRHLIMPVIFRMIYMCGLRLSEARLLRVEDVDLINGILSIHHSKKDNSRLVPMSTSLVKRCRKFSKQIHANSRGQDYYFPALNNKPMTVTNVYHNFRRFLRLANISHRGSGRGPRIYDFRHTYATRCLKKWVEQGINLAAYLPVLKTYMGHDTFRETAYYLHLTADAFPDIMQKVELKYLKIVPELEGGRNETN